MLFLPFSCLDISINSIQVQKLPSFFHLHFDTSFGLLSVRGKSEFNLCIRTYFSKSPNMASIAASLGAQMPCSVINPVTKRWGYVKDVSNSFTIECCSLICSMFSHNPNSSTFQSVTSTLFPRHGLVLFFLDNLFIGSGFVQAQQHTFSG